MRGQSESGPEGPLSSQHLPCGGGKSADTGVYGSTRARTARHVEADRCVVASGSPDWSRVPWLRRAYGQSAGHAERPISSPSSIAASPTRMLPPMFATAARAEPVPNCRAESSISVENVV